MLSSCCVSIKIDFVVFFLLYYHSYSQTRTPARSTNASEFMHRISVSVLNVSVWLHAVGCCIFQSLTPIVRCFVVAAAAAITTSQSIFLLATYTSTEIGSRTFDTFTCSQELKQFKRENERSESGGLINRQHNHGFNKHFPILPDIAGNRSCPYDFGAVLCVRQVF